MPAKKIDGPDFKALTETVGGIVTYEMQPDEMYSVEKHLRAVYAMGMKHAWKLPKGKVEAEIFKITSGEIANYGDDEDDEGEESE